MPALDVPQPEFMDEEEIAVFADAVLGCGVRRRGFEDQNPVSCTVLLTCSMRLCWWKEIHCFGRGSWRLFKGC